MTACGWLLAPAAQRLWRSSSASKGLDGDLLSEVHAKFLQAGYYAPEYRTLCQALDEHLKYTAKRVR